MAEKKKAKVTTTKKIFNNLTAFQRQAKNLGFATPQKKATKKK